MIDLPQLLKEPCIKDLYAKYLHTLISIIKRDYLLSTKEISLSDFSREAAQKAE